MADGFSTESYPKPPALPVQKSMLDQAQQFQQLESNQLSISKQKLDQANQAMGYMTRAMSSLGPNASKEDYLAVGQNAVKMGLVPANMLGAYVERLQKAPSSRAFYDEFVTAAATHQEALDYHLGRQQLYNRGQTDIPIAVSPKFGVRSTGYPTQRDLPADIRVIDTREFLPNGQPNPNYNKEVIQGPTSPVLPEGTEQVPGGIPGQYRPVVGSRLPIQPNPIQTERILPTDKNINLTGPGKTITGVTVEDQPIPNQVVQNRFPAPSGPAVGQAPLFEEGKKAYTEDQALATQKLTALKPLLAAFDLMKDLRSGPGTETWNNSVAFLKANNIIPMTANDPTAIYQEVNKYLNQYVSTNGTRSDADLAKREMSNPDITKQISPALLKLTQSTIAQDRMQAARSGAYESKDYSKYGEHRSKFPAQMDPRAFYIDKMEEGERQKLLDYMYKNKDTKEGKRFVKSLQSAKRSGVLGAN